MTTPLKPAPLVEHSVPQKPSHSRRPDLSTFYALLSEISPQSPTADQPRHRPGAVPVPGDISAAFRSLAEAFDLMRREHEGGTPTTDADPHGGDDDLISTMISNLLQNAEAPPPDVEGVSEEWCASLERVPKRRLRKDMTCPICNEPFLDDPYPLVVRLPCHKDHLFDLECVRPWVRLRGTCPLDRRDFGKEERGKVREWRERLEKEREEDGEEEWDGLYG